MANDQTQNTVRSEQAAHFIATFELKTAPEALMDIAETAFFDTIGVMLAGRRAPVSRLTTEMAAADEAAPVSAIVAVKSVLLCKMPHWLMVQQLRPLISTYPLLAGRRRRP